MDETHVVKCSGCGSKLRFPAGFKKLAIRCPICHSEFEWSAKNQHLYLMVVGGVLFLGAILTIALLLSGKPPQPQASQPAVSTPVSGPYQAAETLSPRKPQPTPPAEYLVLNYAEMLDGSQVVQTGQRLDEALSALTDDPTLRGAVQPFVDHYSHLMPHALSMFDGPDSLPFFSVVDYFPAGAVQPAWVAILRGGRIHVLADGNGRCRVFLPGEEPHSAYNKHYSIIRHCLAALLPKDGRELQVEVWAYEHNYARSEITLYCRRYLTRSRSFPSDNGLLPLDTAGLEAFFKQGTYPEGGMLCPRRGLILFGSQGKKTIAGAPLSLADFAVVYRAAFHAGDNDAFVSLDPHRDPTRVAVNFGGFLENTRVGSVVLEADKRFKTISCGLDPNSKADMRNYTRRYVGDFLTSSEMSFLRDFAGTDQWISTRFWYYPDTIEMETDFANTYARIAKARFVADAERGRDDFSSKPEFELMRKSKLDPSIRQSVDHLNRFYDDYARAFPELEELSTVATLFALCGWLKKVDPVTLDLDAILSVELPAHKTEGERTQMLAVSLLAIKSRPSIDRDYVCSNSSIAYLSDLLDKDFRTVFRNDDEIREYLCICKGVDREQAVRYSEESSQIWRRYSHSTIREFIKSHSDLKAFIEFVADRTEHSGSAEITRTRVEIGRLSARLEALNSQIEGLNRRLKSAAADRNTLVRQHNALVNEYEAVRRAHNKAVEQHNALLPDMIIKIGGGIDLNTEAMTITSSSSPIMRDFIKRAQAGEMISSWAGRGETAYRNRIPVVQWVCTEDELRDPQPPQRKLVSQCGTRVFLQVTDDRTGHWRDKTTLPDGVTRTRHYDSRSRLLTTTYQGGAISYQDCEARVTNNNRIVFSCPASK